jgi:uncharacterized protein (TIGR01777 family)
MKIMVFGSTGFIGERLMKKLEEKGHAVTRASLRGKRGVWEPKIGEQDAVVNLAGEPIFGRRWNTEVKAAIYDSRVDGTRRIIEALHKARDNGKLSTKVLVNASAVGYYGPSWETLDENSDEGADFLAFVCRDWEEQARRAEQALGIRTAITRLGIVLGKEGGALKQLMLPFKLFVGGPVDLGKQWMSWVHVDDVVGLIVHALENDSVRGPLNSVAPNPVTNREFSKALGRALSRPSWLPVPGVALGLVLGEAAEIITTGQKALPKRTLESGYKFRYENIDAALQAAVAEA